MLFFIFTRAAIVEFNPEVPCLYPYFFFNLDNIGVVGVAKGGAILFAGFIALGYIFYGIDKLIKFRE